MKIKKQKESLIQAFRTVADNDINVVPTIMTLDISGKLVIDGASRFLNYDSEKISVNTQGKTIYIHGENLKIGTFSKTSIEIDGKIQKIELFEVK